MFSSNFSYFIIIISFPQLYSIKYSYLIQKLEHRSFLSFQILFVLKQIYFTASTLMGITAQGQIGPRSNGKEGVQFNIIPRTPLFGAFERDSVGVY